MMVPEVSGFDVMETLTTRSTTANAVPVFTTKRLLRADREQLKDQGAGVIEKATFNPEAFIIEMRHTLCRLAGEECQTENHRPA